MCVRQSIDVTYMIVVYDCMVVQLRSYVHMADRTIRHILAECEGYRLCNAASCSTLAKNRIKCNKLLCLQSACGAVNTHKKML